MLVATTTPPPGIPRTKAPVHWRRNADGTIDLIRAPTTRAPTAHQRHFTSVARSAAHWWHTGLQPDCRLIYRASTPYNSSSRPGRQGPRGNGWTLYAGVAFSPIYYNDGTDAYYDCADAGVTFGAWITHAVAATQQLTFLAEYDEAQPPHDRDAIACYILQPWSPNRLNPYRWTRRATCYYPGEGSPLDPTWQAPSPIQFTAGQTVTALIRHHRASAGVLNYVNAVIAT